MNSASNELFLEFTNGLFKILDIIIEKALPSSSLFPSLPVLSTGIAVARCECLFHGLLVSGTRVVTVNKNSNSFYITWRPRYHISNDEVVSTFEYFCASLVQFWDIPTLSLTTTCHLRGKRTTRSVSFWLSNWRWTSCSQFALKNMGLSKKWTSCSEFVHKNMDSIVSESQKGVTHTTNASQSVRFTHNERRRNSRQEELQ